MILVGDVGGTKTIVALYEKSGDQLRKVRDARFSSQEHGSLEQILEKFLEGERGLEIEVACFGVAGAVIEGKSQATNLPWTMEESSLAQATGAPHVKLLNDLQAMAYGMLYLAPEELARLNPRARKGHRGNVGVIAAGTGLGEAMLYWDGERHHPIASEGGHADFGPQTDQEIDLLRYLRTKFNGHVSYERVLSGTGLFNIYQFLRDTDQGQEPDWLAKELERGDPNVTVTKYGLSGEVPLCAAAIRLFSSLYGAEAGNIALRVLAVGGVFIGGGIAPKLLPRLQDGSFMRGFTDKGRFSELLETIEVSVSLNPRAPLIGAAHYATRLS